MPDMATYFNNMRQRPAPPRDPWSHSYSLLTNDEPARPEDDIVSKQAQLAFIGDDKLLRLYQNDVVILTELREMAQRDPMIAPVYKVFYDSWVAELKMTKVLKGMERKLQGTTGGSYIPKSDLGSGFGEQMAEDARNAEANQMDAGTLAGFFNKLKAKK